MFLFCFMIHCGVNLGVKSVDYYAMNFGLVQLSVNKKKTLASTSWGDLTCFYSLFSHGWKLIAWYKCCGHIGDQLPSFLFIHLCEGETQDEISIWTLLLGFQNDAVFTVNYTQTYQTENAKESPKICFMWANIFCFHFWLYLVLICFKFPLICKWYFYHLQGVFWG